jgi:hypothetical protein
MERDEVVHTLERALSGKSGNKAHVLLADNLRKKGGDVLFLDVS